MVFCQFNPDRTGLAFPTKDAVRDGLVNLDELWVNRSYVGIYLWHSDKKQYEAIIRPLASENSTTVLTVATSLERPLPSAINTAGHYIYVTISDQTTTTAAPPTVGYGK